MNKWFKLPASIVLCFGAGYIGSFFTISSINSWYASINKPFFNPPNAVFGPVWSLLYLLMGISLYLVWTNTAKNNKAFVYFFIQLVLNSIWSILFFGLQSPLYAFLEILVLWVFILLTIIEFYRISKPAAYLLLPYILWVSFAAVLNVSIVLLN